MDWRSRYLDQNDPMRLIGPADIQPVVRIANWHDTGETSRWERAIPDLQLILAVAGTFTYRDARDQALLRAGEVLLIEPGIHHVFALAPGVRSGRISGIHGELLPQGRWGDGDYRLDPHPPRITRPADPAAVRDAFRRCASAWAGWSRWRQPLADACAREAVLRLAEAWTGAGGAGPGPDPRTAAMVAWLRTHAVAGAGRGALARRFGCSPEAVDRRFRRALGLTPTAARNRERCRIAYERLLVHGATVAEAAAAAGFADPFYFSRVFRRLYGYPPSQVR